MLRNRDFDPSRDAMRVQRTERVMRKVNPIFGAWETLVDMVKTIPLYFAGLILITLVLVKITPA